MEGFQREDEALAGLLLPLLLHVARLPLPPVQGPLPGGEVLGARGAVCHGDHVPDDENQRGCGGAGKGGGHKPC